MSADNQQTQLTPEQVERIVVAVRAMAMRGNQFALAITKSLAGKSPDDQRKILAGAYGQMFEVMLGFHMAMDSSKSPEEVRDALIPKGHQP